MSKKTNTEQTQTKKFITGIIAILSLFYLISCGYDGSYSPSLSGEVVVELDSIKALTLEGVDENSISVSWHLLMPEEGGASNYTVYAETNDGGGGRVFKKDPTTETVYTLNQGEGTPLFTDGTGKTQPVTITGLVNHTPYRIVAEAVNAHGNTNRSRLLVYTASKLADHNVTGVEVTTENGRTVVSWDAKEGAQFYIIKLIVSVRENQLGEIIHQGEGQAIEQNNNEVVCAPEAQLLCGDGPFATMNGQGKLEHSVPNQGEQVEDAGAAAGNAVDLIGMQEGKDSIEQSSGDGQDENSGQAIVFNDAIDELLNQTNGIIVYYKPSAPTDLKVQFFQGSFAEIENKLYAIKYPLTYTGANNEREAGGSVSNVSYYYRYRVGEREWGGYTEVEDRIDIPLEIEGGADFETMFKGGYGKKYQVEVIASNDGGYTSDPGTLEFIYKSFPEPFKQSENLEVVTGDGSLTVTWPEVTETNWSTVGIYNVILRNDPYGPPLKIANALAFDREVVFKDLENDQPYYITVVPNGVDTGNLFNALSVVTDYTYGGAIKQGSRADRILTAYTGVPVPYTHQGTSDTPQGTPEVVVNLVVTAREGLATVTWESPATGNPATKYVVEYLEKITAPITDIAIGGDASELSGLSWDGATSIEVPTNIAGSYSYEVDGLDLYSTTNVFRVRGVRVDDSGKEWLGEYRYYALGTVHLSPPQNLRQAQCAKSTSVDLAWDASPGATSYKVYRDGAEIARVTSTSYTDRGLSSGKQYTYTVRACNDTCSSDSDSVTITTLTTVGDKSFKGIIESGLVPRSLIGYDERSQEIFSRYNRNVCVVAKYLKPGGTGDGSSLADAAGNLGEVLEGITDASFNKVYTVLLTGGTYQAGRSMEMKRHVAIIGGVDEGLGFSETTALDGEGEYRVFHNQSYEGLDDTALLYRVTITGGKADQGGGMYNDMDSSPNLIEVTFSGNHATEYGGGMYNSYAFPILEGVTFSGNTADYGGGMYNFQSSPSLEETSSGGVTFSGNTAYSGGGGMANEDSSPTLEGVAFLRNTVTVNYRLEWNQYGGGGMYNFQSSPVLVGVTFSENTAEGLVGNGGGMFNVQSSPTLEGVTFSSNMTDRSGGGMGNKDSSPILVGVTFSGNTALVGGGMANEGFSPVLEGVTFSGNTALVGGGMYNRDSSPILERVTFSSNTADSGGPWYEGGGGMQNHNSSPILDGVTFSGNTAGFGGGMQNHNSSPILDGVTFSGNTARSWGGGMDNYNSSPILDGVTFSGNTARSWGGGMFNDNDGQPGPLIVNGIFWGNTAPSGSQFYFNNTSTNHQENLRIYNSIVQGGTGNLVSGATNTSVNQVGFGSGNWYGNPGTGPIVISFSNIIDKDPGLLPLADNGGSVPTHAIAKTSPAVNQGFYVKRKATTVDDKKKYTFYYSADNSTWYTEPDLATSIIPPTDAEYLTDTDATGYTRTGRPDLGAYEAR